MEDSGSSTITTRFRKERHLKLHWYAYARHFAVRQILEIVNSLSSVKGSISLILQLFIECVNQKGHLDYEKPH